MEHFRSLLFVPGHRAEWIAKAPRYGADALVLDLEDAVPVNEKANARRVVQQAIGELRTAGVPSVVRLNALETGLTAEDIEAIVASRPVAVVAPKLSTVEEVLRVDALIEASERKAGLAVGTVEIIVLPETALGMKNAYELASCCSRVGNLVGGTFSRSGDTARALGYKWTRGANETLYFTSHLLLAARAAGIKYPIASSAQEFRNLELVQEKLTRAANFGFRGAFLIHPSQVEIAHRVFERD